MNSFDGHGYKQTNVSFDNGWLANLTQLEIDKTCIVNSNILKTMPGVIRSRDMQLSHELRLWSSRSTSAHDTRTSDRAYGTTHPDNVETYFR